MSEDPQARYGLPSRYAPYAPPSLESRTPPLWPEMVPPQRTHSILGIVSLFCSLLASIGLITTIGLAGFIEVNTPGGIDEAENTAIILGLTMFGFLFLAFISLGLGVGALCQSDRRKLFPILGIVFSALVIVITIALMGIGMSME